MEESESLDALRNEGFGELCSLLAETTDKDFLEAFLRSLFTPAEVTDFANRWLLVKEIDKGTTQRDIAQKFGLSLCKITRGSRELKKEGGPFQKMLAISKARDKK